jgi:hypothetical protein
MVAGDTTIVPSGTLREPGAITLVVPQAISGDSGYAYLPGTDIVALHAPGRDEVELDSIPAGTIPEIRFNDNGDSTVVIKLNVKVLPADHDHHRQPLLDLVRSRSASILLRPGRMFREMSIGSRSSSG